MSVRERRCVWVCVCQGQMWQINYRLALLCEALGDTEGAEAAINAAFKHAYFNEILLTKVSEIASTMTR
jgi:hypothetical protein